MNISRTLLATLLIALACMDIPSIASGDAQPESGAHPATTAPTTATSDPATTAPTTATSDPAATTNSASTYSADSLYNLGNAYARAGKPGLAVLNYERARLLTSYDPDIEANLRFVRDSAKVPTDPQSAFERTVRIASPTTLAWSGLTGLLLAGILWVAGGAATKHRGVRRGGIAIGIALMGLTVCNGMVLWPTLHAAVILTAATPARVSPAPMGDPVFTLPEAETVSMKAEHEGFVLVQTRTGKTGWVADANLAPVVPRY